MYSKINLDKKRENGLLPSLHEWNAEDFKSRLNDSTMTNLSFETIEPIVRPLIEHRPFVSYRWNETDERLLEIFDRRLR